MKLRKKILTVAVLLAVCITVHLYALHPHQVEKGYSLKIFPFIAASLRVVFGAIPFSTGDILYGAAGIFLIVKIFRFSRKIFSKAGRNLLRKNWAYSVCNLLIVVCTLYSVFNIFWGINYNREGITKQIGLDLKPYNISDLKEINTALLQKVNSSKIAASRQYPYYPSDKELFKKVNSAYANVSKKYPFLKYRHPALKTSLWGWLGNYSGFTGYYNPFTGEAQVNTTVPKFTQPFVACHEAAHAIGYAKEMEANFVGYLAATSSEDTIFHYSVYADLFLYANRTLFFADSTAALNVRKLLLPQVVSDFKERAKFNREHASFLEPVVRIIYGKYLEQNQQPQGLWSYDEVTAFIIAYYKKFGTI